MSLMGSALTAWYISLLYRSTSTRDVLYIEVARLFAYVRKFVRCAMHCPQVKEGKHVQTHKTIKWAKQEEQR